MTEAAALRIANRYMTANDGDVFDARAQLGTERTMWFDRMVAHTARLTATFGSPDMDGVEPTDELFTAVAVILDGWCEID